MLAMYCWSCLACRHTALRRIFGGEPSLRATSAPEKGFLTFGKLLYWVHAWYFGRREVRQSAPHKMCADAKLKKYFEPRRAGFFCANRLPTPPGCVIPHILDSYGRKTIHLEMYAFAGALWTQASLIKTKLYDRANFYRYLVALTCTRWYPLVQNTVTAVNVMQTSWASESPKFLLRPIADSPEDQSRGTVLC